MEMKFIEGFHGTDYNNSENIIKNGFKASRGDLHWLGDGAYFFIEGLSKSPEIDAEKWAIAESWDKKQKEHKYLKYAVIQSKIKVKDNLFLDLNTDDGQKVFGYLRKCFITKITKARKKLKDGTFIDGEVINLARKEGIIDLEVVKGNFFFKFAKERIFNINSRMPNVTICTVFDVTKNIEKSKNKIIKIGEIEDEIR